MASLVPPSPDVPVVQADGRINEQWRAFFYELWRRSGGQQEAVLIVGAGLTGEGTENQPLLLDFLHPSNVDHLGVSIIAGTGLAGGGTIEQSRTLRIDFSELGIDANPPLITDFFIIQRGDEPPRRVRAIVVTELVEGNLQTHIDSTAVHGATSSPTPERLVLRDVNANAEFADPTSAQHAATKKYVDDERADHETTVANHDDVTFTLLANDDFIQRKAGSWVNRTPAQVAGDLDHANLQGTGSNTHAQIDTHIADVANPHAVTKTQVGLGNVLNVAQVENAGGNPSIESGLVSTRPAAGTAGRWFFATDENILYRDTGAVWETVLSRDHADLDSIGTNTHAQIDSHIADGDIHVAHSGVVLSAGAGLTGGGSIAASRSFDVGAGTGITVAADSVSFDTTFGDARYALVSHTHTLSDITDSGAAAAAGVKNSVEINLGDIQLVGDEAAPTADKYYGTDSLGARGFHALPSGGGGGASSLNDLSDVTLSALGVDELLFTQDGVTFINQTLAEADIASAAALSSHIGDTANPHVVTKAQVGLGSVDDVSAASLRDRATHTGTEPATAFATGPGVITPTMMSDGASVSLLGRSIGSNGPRADIIAPGDNVVLRRTATTLNFGQLTAGMFPMSPGVVSPNHMLDANASSVLGRSVSSSGPRADIQASVDDRLFARVSGVLQFVQLNLGMIPDGLITDAKLAVLEAGTFDPTVIFSNLGDLSVDYHVRTGEFTRAGDLVIIKITLDFTPTYTTASGEFRLSDLPFAASSADWLFQVRPFTANTLAYPANRVWMLAELATASLLRLVGLADNLIPSTFGTTQFPSGARKGFKLSGVYRRAAV